MSFHSQRNRDIRHVETALEETEPLLISSDQTTRPQRSGVSIADIKALGDSIAQTLDLDKAENIKTIELAGKTSIADLMIIASGRSSRHVSALSDHILKFFKERGKSGLHIEGLPQADWVLIDTGDIIIHLFRPEVREFYKLEKIWA